ncbi:MAG TPA: hypothetical protein VKM94_24980 [Blastocatellia bacterium]|nr:hypothetical protein [Blastocatellia bacterium]
MRIRPEERQRLAEIFLEEIEATRRRVSDRFQLEESLTVLSTSDELVGIRQFYCDLADSTWTPADEEVLTTMKSLSDSEIKHMMREGFRRLRVHPVPSFASLITALRKNPDEPIAEPAPDLRNCDAVPATERERMANVLHRELDEAARAIATRLKLGEAKFAVVREQLETVEGAVISEFTPLV